MADAVELLKENPEMNTTRMESRSIFTCGAFVYHWTAPLQASFATLLAGYQRGEYITYFSFY